MSLQILHREPQRDFLYISISLHPPPPINTTIEMVSLFSNSRMMREVIYILSEGLLIAYNIEGMFFFLLNLGRV